MVHCVHADDMILLSPSWLARHNLINILEKCCSDLDIVCNTKKTVCMVLNRGIDIGIFWMNFHS